MKISFAPNKVAWRVPSHQLILAVHMTMKKCLHTRLIRSSIFRIKTSSTQSAREKKEKKISNMMFSLSFYLCSKVSKIDYEIKSIILWETLVSQTAQEIMPSLCWAVAKNCFSKDTAVNMTSPLVSADNSPLGFFLSTGFDWCYSSSTWTSFIFFWKEKSPLLLKQWHQIWCSKQHHIWLYIKQCEIKLKY